MSWNKASAVDKSYFGLENRFPFIRDMCLLSLVALLFK